MLSDEKGNKQCSYYMYLSNFEAGAFCGEKSVGQCAWTVI